MLGWGWMLVVIGGLLACPDTTWGRIVRHALVERPAQALNRITSGRLVFYALLGLGGLVLTLLFEMEGLRLFGMLLPDTLLWFALFDVGVFVDAMLIASALLATSGLRVVRAEVERLGRTVAAHIVRRSGRAPRPRRRVKPRRSDAEDRPAGPAQPAYRVFSMA